MLLAMLQEVGFAVTLTSVFPLHLIRIFLALPGHHSPQLVLYELSNFFTFEHPAGR